MIYLTNIDLNGNELQNAVIQPLASAPSSPKLGQVYCDSTNSRIKWYNGSTWNVVGVVVESSATNGAITVDGVTMTVYDLPVAGADTLGGIKVGTGLSIDANGVLSVTSAGSVAWANITDHPTKLSEFSNMDTGFITNTCNNLTNYYKKTETYSQSEVNDLVSSLRSVSISVVNVLPAEGVSNIIYLVPKSNSQPSNAYDEYIWTNNTFECIGNTEVDLSNYVQSSSLATVATSGSYEDLINKPTRLVYKTLTLAAGNTTVSRSEANYSGVVGAYDVTTGEQVLCDVSYTGGTLKVDISVAQSYAITIMYLVRE